MSVDVPSSPYSVPPGGTAEDGLGYSRHYAKRIRDMGRTSKDSWIKRLWNHMFVKGKDKDSQDNDAEDDKTLPPINREGSLVSVRPSASPKSSRASQDKPRQNSSNNGSNKKSNVKVKMLPVELANSPYIAPRDRPNYKVEKRTPQPPKEKRTSTKDSGIYVRKPVHPYLSQHTEPWRPRITRAPNMIHLEKRARAAAEKAMKDAKIFSCIAPYPVDAYIRCSLRKRGWVEKFGPKANQSSKNNNIGKLECEDEEDFEAICDQEVPPPWEEDHGVYAMMSRCARHYPPKFIWGGRNVNSLILKSDVMTNHFPKARHFSSKVLLAQSLRELPWQNDGDPNDFFPRCYVLGEDDKDDIIEDFRLTACMSLLKWVLRTYLRSNRHRGNHGDGPPEGLFRENTKYEEVTSSKDCEQPETNTRSIFDDIVTPEPDTDSDRRVTFMSPSPTVANDNDTDNNNNEDLQRESSCVGDAMATGDNTTADNAPDPLPEDYESLICTDDVTTDTNSTETDNRNREGPVSAKQRSSTEKVVPELRRSKSSTFDNVQSSSSKKPDKGLTVAPPNRERPINGLRQQRFKLPEATNQESANNTLVIPDLKTAKSKKGGEVPSKAVDWAISHLQRYVKSRKNEDLDLKYDAEGKNPLGPEESVFRKRGLSQPQWKQLLEWYYDVSQNSAVVAVTESQLREAESTLRRLRDIWPQYEIDGKRNIWIIKPGEKSKAIGIEFTDKLDDILKYVSNTTIQGTYVIQKYIERPLLVYKCKFDIRQWFLVTEWNPLTIWFYKDSYLRICSQEYQYDSMHESVHLSNVAVQQNYLNGTRSDKLPDNNYMTSTGFQEYLSEVGAGNAWKELVYPGMKRAIVNTLIATQDVYETRKNAFELYGADFMISENYQPWLIEINASPGMAPSSVEKVRLCSTVIEDTIKVVVDRKESSSCSTGRFELVLRDAPIPATKCVETKFVLEGQRIRRMDLQRYTVLDQKNTRAEEEKDRKERLKAEKLKQQREDAEKKEEPATEGGESTELSGEEPKKDSEEAVQVLEEPKLEAVEESKQEEANAEKTAKQDVEEFKEGKVSETKNDSKKNDKNDKKQEAKNKKEAEKSKKEAEKNKKDSNKKDGKKK